MWMRVDGGGDIGVRAPVHFHADLIFFMPSARAICQLCGTVIASGISWKSPNT